MYDEVSAGAVLHTMDENFEIKYLILKKQAAQAEMWMKNFIFKNLPGHQDRRSLVESFLCSLLLYRSGAKQKSFGLAEISTNFYFEAPPNPNIFPHQQGHIKNQ